MIFFTILAFLAWSLTTFALDAREKAFEDAVARALEGFDGDATDATSVAMHGLSLFRSPEKLLDAVPLLEHSLRLSGEESNDFVAMNYLAGAYHMLARKRYAQGFDDESLLQRAVYYFTQAHRKRGDLTAAADVDALSPEAYPQLKYAKPKQLTFRAWGDSLAWLGHNAEAHLIFKFGKTSGVWRDMWCRPQMRLPLQIFALQAAKPYVFPAEDFPHVHRPVSEALPRALEEYRAIEATSITGANAWALEQSGLHATKSWRTLPLIIDGKRQVPGCEMMPDTCDALLKIPSIKWLKVGQVKVSVMGGGTTIRPHAGPTSARLRMVCTLKLPEWPSNRAGWIRVGDPDLAPKLHFKSFPSCFVFREACQHEVHISRKATTPRAVLLVDFLNPFLFDSAFVDQIGRNGSEPIAPEVFDMIMDEYSTFAGAQKEKQRPKDDL